MYDPNFGLTDLKCQPVDYVPNAQLESDEPIEGIGSLFVMAFAGATQICLGVFIGWMLWS